MANPLSNDLREKIVKHKQNGEKGEHIAKWLMISKSSVNKIWSRFCKKGSVDPEPLNRGRKPMITSEEMKKVEKEVEENPDVTLEELKDKFNLKISISAISRRISKLGYTFKKRRSIHKHEKEKT